MTPYNKKRGYYISPMAPVLFVLGVVTGILLCLLFAPPAAAAEEEVVAVQNVPIESPVPVIVLPEEPEEPKQPELESIGLFTMTAYCPCQSCCGRWADGITATGTEATEGRTIAVDPGVIELGSTVYFEGMDGLVSGYVAEDTGGAIKGNRIDVFFDSHNAALQYGVRELEVFVVK